MNDFKNYKNVTMDFKINVTLMSLISLILVSIGCSKEESEIDYGNEFNSLKNSVLGYDWWGQQDTWMDADNLFNVYEDALVFKKNDSIDIGYVGFGYGHHDLSKLYVNSLGANRFSYTFNNNLITIYSGDSVLREWRINVVTDTSLVIHQLHNNMDFFLKFDEK